MVAPLPVDLLEGGREPLVPEAQAPDEGEGAGVAGLDVRLQAVQPQRAEGVPDHEAQPLGQVTPAGRRRVRGEAEGAALPAASEDVVDVDPAHDRPGLAQADHEPLVRRPREPFQAAFERLRRQRVDAQPGPVQLGALAGEGGDLGVVLPAEVAQGHAGGLAEVAGGCSGRVHRVALVDAELVALDVQHRDARVVAVVQRPHVDRAEGDQPCAFGFQGGEALRAHEAGSDPYVEVQPVLGGLALGDVPEVRPGAHTVGIFAIGSP